MSRLLDTVAGLLTDAGFDVTEHAVRRVDSYATQDAELSIADVRGPDGRRWRLGISEDAGAMPPPADAEQPHLDPHVEPEWEELP